MKKWVIGFLALVSAFLIYIYLIIQDNFFIGKSITVHVNRQGLHRSLFDENNWTKWWPGNSTLNKTGQSPRVFNYDGSVYKIIDKKISSLIISINKNDATIETSLDMLPVNTDSVQLLWEGKLPASYNPAKRLRSYFRLKKINHELSVILETMQSFFSKTENIYGYDIKKERVVDSILVSTYSTSKGYPPTRLIYSLINQLKDYIVSKSAEETGFPMLNIRTDDSITYTTKVAIPVNKRLESSGNISFKGMLGGGNILITEVKGGPATINLAYQQIENYISDYGRVAPAIPFLSLVTDRTKETDTTKWVTRICYPVM